MSDARHDHGMTPERGTSHGETDLWDSTSAAGPRVSAREFAEAIYLAAWQTAKGGDTSLGEGGRERTERGKPPERDAGPPRTDASERSTTRFVGKKEPEDASHGRVAVSTGHPQVGGRVDEEPLRGTSATGFDRQRFIKALRPFHLHVLDHGRWEVDAEATAREYARSLLYTAMGRREGHNRGAVTAVPLLVPSRKLGVHLTVFVDDSRSMELQQETVRALVGLLRSAGVFRSVWLRRFESDTATPDRVVVHGPDFTALPEQGAIHVAVVLSDGIGRGWTTGSVQSWLGHLANGFPVALIHLLSARQWRRTGIRPEAMEVTATGRARAPANRRYSDRPFRWPQDLPLPPARKGSSASSVVLPVLPLRPEAVRAWAEFVMDDRAGRTLNVSALRVVPGDAAANAVAPGPVVISENPVDMVRRFHRSSSTESFRLAVDLAVVPLADSVLDAVCQHFSERSRTSELAEVIFSGLVRQVDPAVVTSTGRIRWEYRPGIRRTLLSLGGRRSRIRNLLVFLAAEFERDDPWFSVLRQMLNGDRIRLPQLDETSLWFADSTLPALESIGLAQRYRRLVRYIRERTLPSGEVVVYQESPPPFATKIERTKVEALPTERRGEDSAADRDAEETTHASTTADKSPTPAGESDMTSHGAESTPNNVPEDASPNLFPASRRTGTTAWGNVPPRNPMFTGRTDLLLRIREQLVAGTEQGRVMPSVLNGLPGIGKTQLATEYLYRYSENYELIWWIPASHANQVHEAYTLLAQELGTYQPGAPVTSMVHAVREALRRGTRYRRWLLVFDDARQPEDVARYLPVGGDGHIIITSRNLVWAARSSHAALTVDVFSRQESIELLRRCGPEDLTENEADELAEALGDLPIALRQAAAWMYETATPVAEYLAQFQEKRSEILPTLTPADPDYPVTVITTWNISLDNLATTNPAALQLLQVCAFFSTAPIPRYLFTYVRDISAPPALSEALSNPTKLSRALSEISRYGLAQINHRTRTIQLHQLVQRALRFPMTEEERKNFRHCVHMLLAKGAPQDNSPEARERHAALFSHVWAAKAWDCPDPWVRDLVIQQIQVANLRGEYEASRKLAETVLAAWKETYGADAPETLRVELCLVRVLRNLGEHRQAYELCERTLGRLTELYGPDAEETLEASNEFIRDLQFAGQFRESAELARVVHDKHRRLLGPEDPETLDAAHRYAYALLLSGDHQKAAELFRETYRVKEMVLGPNAPKTLGSIDGYTDALMESGEYREALGLQRENTENVKALFGEDNRGTLSNSVSLAMMLRRLGYLEEALELSRKVWLRTTSRFGPRSGIALHAASNYSAALRVANHYGEALELAEETCRRYGEYLAEDHPHVVVANINRAVVLRLLGRVVEAREIDEQALETLTARLGEDHTITISCAINLASDLFALGDVSGALRLDTENLERCRRVLTERHLLTLLARHNLALDRRARGGEVEEELVRIERLYLDVVSEQHPAVLAVRRGVRGNADVYLGQL